MQVPASNLFPNRLYRFVGNSRTEVDEEFPLPILRPSRPKSITEKIELLVEVCPSPVLIPAIDSLRLLRMKFHSTLLQTRSYGRPDFLCFCLCPAMHDGIVGEPLKRISRILHRHPPIKSIVQKQIRQQRADDTALRRSLLTRDQ